MTTVRDVNPRRYVDLLAAHLRMTQTIRTPSRFGNIEDDSFYSWWYKQAASIIHQLYLHPSLSTCRCPCKGRGLADRSKQLIQYTHSNIMKQFSELGWIVKDQSGLVLVSKAGQRQMDDIAASVSNSFSNR